MIGDPPVAVPSAMRGAMIILKYYHIDTCMHGLDKVR